MLSARSCLQIPLVGICQVGYHHPRSFQKVSHSHKKNPLLSTSQKLRNISVEVKAIQQFPQEIPPIQKLPQEIPLIQQLPQIIRPPPPPPPPPPEQEIPFRFFGRKAFGSGFVFGVGTSAYQYEGGAEADGKGPSIWDTFAHTPGKIVDGSNGDVANDQYNRARFQEDVRLLKDMGVDSYRFSISWPRILPNGRGDINVEGVAFYNYCIKELLDNGIKPVVTLYHWDLPQALEDEYGGFLSPQIVKDFTNYADTCFELFGDRVKMWTTLNEPQIFSNKGYNNGTCAPGHSSKTEPYIVGHNLLLSHASAVKLYRDHYQKTQNGIIGITLDTSWYEPYSDSFPDELASRRKLDFAFGWFLEPVANGDYPNSMRTLLGERLPQFTTAESQLLKGSFDFIGLNYYTAKYARDDSFNPNGGDDSKVITSNDDENGLLIGPQAYSAWLHVYPEGIRKLLNHVKEKYNNPPVYITENGRDEANTGNIPTEESLDDTSRIDYHFQHLENILLAKSDDGCNVRGYFAWTFMDDIEWASGFTSRFGFYFVDRTNGLKRHAKKSVSWLRQFLKH